MIAALAIAAATRSARAEDTQPYRVQEGDSCLGIALRMLGERTAVRDIHRLNPQLGAMPHELVAGSVLTLPARAASGPDARLTSARGDVKIRKPSTAAWDAARRGMDLFRAYRVGAASEAAAELTFGDDGVLEMRERTIVVIYGPQKQKAALILATAELERGTLEGRLGELDGKHVVVRTPAAIADLRAADAVLRAGDGGPSVLSNHRGGAIEVRGRSRQRGAVKVAAGMGTRVVPGKAPETPRPLPATPAWSTPSGPQLVGVTGSVAVAWTPVDRAVQYRVAIRDPRGETLRALFVTAPSATAALPLEPGTYKVTVAALDVDQFESRPSETLDLAVVKPVFVAPNGLFPGAGAAAPRTIALGTTIIAPDHYACSIGAQPTHRTLLVLPGHVELYCTSADGKRTQTLQLDVVPLAKHVMRTR